MTDKIDRIPATHVQRFTATAVARASDTLVLGV
jgi:hypothetical protein